MFLARRKAALGAWLVALSVFGLLLLFGGQLAARDKDVWKVKNKLIGKAGKDEGDSKKAENISGIACPSQSGFPRTCLVVDDESQGAQIVILKQNQLIAGDFIQLINSTHKDKPLELDAEGVAYAEGYFYVVGSHGRSRHPKKVQDRATEDARTEATRHVFRLRFDVGNVGDDGRLGGPVEIETSTALSELLRAQPLLAFDKPLENEGMTIEGLGVRGQQVFIGLRAPLLDKENAAVLSVPISALFGGPKGEAPRLHSLPLRKRGIRDMAAFGSGFLLLAGPVLDPPQDVAIKGGDYSVFWWDGQSASVQLLRDLPAYGDNTDHKPSKPEAILPIDRQDGRLRVMLLFDGPREGAPRVVEVDEPKL